MEKVAESFKAKNNLRTLVLNDFNGSTGGHNGVANGISNHWLLMILPVLGISFWFSVGFPFADRNESYVWIAYLQQYSFFEIIQNNIPSIRNFRPMAQAITWCLYHLSGGNGILVQCINFILLCSAIWIIIPLTEASKTLYVRLFYLAIGFVYFSSFYYIFNLHGIFYSPILLLIALFLKAQDGVLTNWKKWLPISLLLAFFHPFILIFYAAYVTGWLIEREQMDKTKIIILGFILLVLLMFLKLILPFPIFSVIDIQNLLGTTRNVESHSIIKAFTLFLCLLILPGKKKQQQVFLLASIAIYLPLAMIYDFPFLLLLAFLIVLSLIIEGKWSLAGLVVAAISFPIAVGSGAPTKACIFIFLIPHLIVRTLPFSWVVKDRITKATSLVMVASIICWTVLIRMEIEIPLLSRLISPVLVEKGKSFQLEKALMMAQHQALKTRVQFLQEKQVNIRDYGQPKQRNYFPPTKQNELDTYQHYALREAAGMALPKWYIAFGTEFPSDTLKLVYTLQEKNCKPAYLYERLVSPD